MKILLTGGGTAGHINPALSVAKYFKNEDENTEFLFVGNKDRMESRVVPKAGIEFIGIPSTGISRKVSIKGFFQNIKAAYQQVSGKRKCKKILKQFEPDIVFSTGGYISVPVMRAAFSLGIPTVIHESNSFPGMATKAIAKKVDMILCVDEEAKKRIDTNVQIKVTGNPLNPDILSADRQVARKSLGIEDSDICILSFGGSLGAETINKVMAKVMSATSAYENVKHIHSYGSIYVPYFKDYLKEAGVFEKDERLDIREYIDNMPDCMAASDIIISRSGAITVDEVSAIGRASILIPSPNVTENHQYHNAMRLGGNGGAYVIEEKDLDIDDVIKKTIKLATDEEFRNEMARKSHETSVLDANERIADAIKNVLEQRTEE